jgi:AmiR/NasT family two-component response regulator
MCRALRVLCAAPDRERLLALKRATVSAQWELVGGACSLDELVSQVDGVAPDVVVIDAGIGPHAASRVREHRATARIVSVGGPMRGADAHVGSGAVREAIMGVPPVGGPVRS